MTVRELLKIMMEKGATDLHLKAGRPPLLRIGGKLMPLEAERLTPENVKNLIYEIMTPEQIQRFEEKHELDIGYSIPGLSRFRVNIFFQRGTVEAVFRAIPFEVPTIDKLGLPEILKELALKNQGLIIVTGPTGSGKTTTLAAMIDYINEHLEGHIITIEDPIEYLHKDKKCSISQREIGYDTYSYADALKYVLRQDPDVILIGEMRDVETVRISIKAAEVGRLVLTTMHTMDAPQTIDRIITYFPKEEQRQIRMQLALLLQGIICQRLLKTVDGKSRCAAVEVMVNSPQIKKLIEEGEIGKIHDAIASSVTYFKMQTLNQSLVALCLSGIVTVEEAISASPDPDEFKRILHDLQTGRITSFEKEKTYEDY